MKLQLTRIAVAITLSMAAASSTFAEASASSASSAGSASVGSVSDSFRGSSNSSARGNHLADGDYRVIEVAEVADRPGMLRLMLQAADGDSGVSLDLPRQALAQRPLHAGSVVHAQQRPYGWEFAHADTRQAFFLVLADDWYRELDPRAVTL
ncbi:MAG: hypothetical protein HY021_07735 [Burkholderiales bacterium]|nr:hypothetical protein [Burkholderiales bacterium]